MSKILIIEDDPRYKAMLARLLRGQQHDVIEASNGYFALDVAQSYLPDVILCDIELPEMDGFAVLEALSQQPATADIPFIFMTGHHDPEYFRRGMNLGADDFLTKPFDMTTLLAAINRRLDKHKQRQQQSHEALDELRRNIAYALPHEFRTPLTLIMGYAELLTDEHGKNDPELATIGQSIMEAAERLHRMSEKFWAYIETDILASQPAGKRRQFRHADTQAVRKIGLSLAVQQQRQGDIHFDIQEDYAPIADEDLARISRELIDNALKFSQPGTPIKVSARSDIGMFRLTVSDQGFGMSSDEVKRIGAYNQFERPLRQQPGIGLGLAIVQRLAQLYDGRLVIDSVPDHHTHASILIPIPLQLNWGGLDTHNVEVDTR